MSQLSKTLPCPNLQTFLGSEAISLFSDRLLGLIFGDYVAVFHPGLGGDYPSGSFRIEKGIFADERERIIPNQDMGFIPAFDTLHHLEASIENENNGLLINVSITGLGIDSQTHSYNYSFFDDAPVLNSGEIGVRILGSTPSGTDGFFDNLKVETAPVPEPATMLLFGSALIGLFGSVENLEGNVYADKDKEFRPN